MTTRAVGLAAVLLVTLCPHPGEAAERVAVVVGNNRGAPDEVTLRYAELDAEKVARVLTELGGFAADNVHLRVGAAADDLRGLLRALARRPRRGPVQLFFYYSGHGTGSELHLSGSRLPLAELKALLAGVDADLRVVVLDSCKSGELIREKGAAKGEPFLIDAVLEPEVAGSVVITSSSSSEAAQESDRLRGSFFTHHLVSGLYGAADADHDGRVTLEEAYAFAHFHTLDSTSAGAGAVQHPSYGLALTGRGEIVFTTLERSTAEIEISGDNRTGQYFVVDPTRELVLLELVLSGSKGLRARLPPGRYRVRKRDGQRIFSAAVVLRAGRTSRVRDEDLVEVRVVQPRTKGAGVDLSRTSHRIHLSTGLRNQLVEEAGPVSQILVGYRLLLGPLLVEPRAMARTGFGSPGSSELDLGFAIGLYTQSRRFAASLALDLGAIAFFPESPEPRPPLELERFGFQGGAATTAEMALGSNWLLSFELRAGMGGYRTARGLSLEPVVAPAIGITYVVR